MQLPCLIFAQEAIIINEGGKKRALKFWVLHYCKWDWDLQDFTDFGASITIICIFTQPKTGIPMPQPKITALTHIPKRNKNQKTHKKTGGTPPGDNEEAPGAEQILLT